MLNNYLHTLFFACLLSSLAPATSALAQALPRPRTPAQAEAERILIQARCSLHSEESKFQLRRGERVMVSPTGHVDHVAFPVDVKDADLARLLPYVAKLPALKSLDLGNCDQFTEKGLRHLKLLPKLEVLVLDGTTVNAAGLKELANVKGLRFLDLSRTPLVDPDLKALGALQQLSSLVVREMPRLTEDGIQNILNLGKIRFLDITIEKSPDKMARTLSGAKFLAALKVAPISDNEAIHLGKMAALDTLDLSNDDPNQQLNVIGAVKNRVINNTITNQGVNKLVGCKALRSLDLSYTWLDGSGLNEFTKIEGLEEIYVRGTRWSDLGVVRLAAMPTLRVIDLRDTRASDRSMEDLADLPTLQRLYLAGLPLTDAGLQDLTRLRTLQVLDLSSTNVSCVRVRDMKNFSQLEHLHLAGTHVTSSSFYVLGSIKSLRFLNLLDNLPEVSTASVPPLKAELPTCMIIASEPRPQFSYYGFGNAAPLFIGWPGAVYYSFRVPEVTQPKLVTTPKPVTTKPITTIPINTPPPAVVKAPPAPPRPPAPPPIRIVPVGGGTSARP